MVKEVRTATVVRGTLVRKRQVLEERSLNVADVIRRPSLCNIVLNGSSLAAKLYCEVVRRKV